MCLFAHGLLWACRCMLFALGQQFRCVMLLASVAQPGHQHCLALYCLLLLGPNSPSSLRLCSLTCCSYYHASLDSAEREDVQRRWSNDEIQVGAQRGSQQNPHLWALRRTGLAQPAGR
jgi:hypothetical protein